MKFEPQNMQVKTKGLVKVDTFKKWNKQKIKVGCWMAANSWLLLHSSHWVSEQNFIRVLREHST